MQEKDRLAADARRVPLNPMRGLFCASPNVRVASQAELTALIFDVCLTPNIRHPFDGSGRQLWANSGKSPIGS